MLLTIIKILIVVFLAAVYGANNYFRGRGDDSPIQIGRWGCVLVSGMATGIVAACLGAQWFQSIAVFAASTLGFFIYLDPAWGPYFSSFTWKWPSNRRGVPFIDWIGFKLVPIKTYNEDWTNGLRGFICEILRGLFLVPMFVMLGLVLHNLMIWELGFLGALQAPVYAANRIDHLYDRKGTAMPESVMGSIIGAAAGLSLVWGFL